MSCAGRSFLRIAVVEAAPFNRVGLSEVAVPQLLLQFAHYGPNESPPPRENQA